MGIVFVVGLVMRAGAILGYLHMHGFSYWAVERVEPYLIATSLANNGTYADVFGGGVGPTAHTAPMLPMILAVIIKVAGVGLAGFLMQAILAAIAASAAFALLPVLGVKCRLGMLPGVIAGLIGAAVPINFWNQTVQLFDAPYTMLGVVGLCILLSSYWVSECFPIRGAVLLGVVCGTICLLNPIIMEILAGWYILGLLHFTKKRGAFSIFMATIAAIIVLFLCPWAYRNYKALGGGVWTRSNFGLELSVSNNDHASAEYEVNIYSPDFPHPFTQLEERIKVREMGELAYNQARKNEALLWIRNHPGAFSHLTMLRFFYFWFPPMRQWWKSIAEALIAVLAIAGLIGLFKKHHPSSWMFLAVIVFYPAVYLIVQVGPRYRLPIEPILLLLACSFCLDMWNTAKGNWRRRDLTPAGGD
jgi:hypothetical protein